MNVLIASLMLLSAIQADAAQLSFVSTQYPIVDGDGDVVAIPVGDGAGPLDLNDAMQTLADEKAEASEMRQRAIEEHLHEVEQKRYVVAAKLRGIDQIVKSDEDRHRILKKKGLLTDDRNAKNYLHDADQVVTGKIELKIEKRARFAAEVIQQKHVMERNEAMVVKKQEQVKDVEAKWEKQKQEKKDLLKLKEKEAYLNSKVRQSQQSRLSDINEKLGLDRRGIDALAGNLKLEASQETRLTSELAQIVHNADELGNMQATLKSKTEKLELARKTIEQVEAKAAQDKLDCAQNKVSLAEQKAMPRAGAGDGAGATTIPLGKGGFLGKQ